MEVLQHNKGADVEAGLAHQSENRAVQAVTEALDVAALVLQSGGSASMADASLKNVLKGYGAQTVSTAYRQDFIAAGGVENGHPWTMLRPLAPAGLHLVRASEAATLSARLAHGEVGTADFASQVQRIKQLASPYNRWVMTLAAACAAAAFSRTAGGDWGAMGVVLVAAAVGQFASGGHFLLRTHLRFHCCRWAKAWFERSGRGNADRFGYLYGSGHPAYQRLC
jgi:uncharacterized membrane protein YjjP (DUF1212 family)